LKRAAHELARLNEGAAIAGALGLEVHAGHGLDFATAEKLAEISEIRELNIGHFIIGEAIFIGLHHAIMQMRAAINQGRTRARPR
jgi:pyridoxine 5-phosphate synthase